MFPLPTLPAKSITALIPLTNFSWKSNPIDTTQSGGYHHLRLWASGQAIRWHSPRNQIPPARRWMSSVPPTPRRRRVALSEAAGRPERASVPSTSQLRCPPYPPARCTASGRAPHRRWGLQAPVRVVALHLSSTFPTPGAAGAGKQAEQGGRWQGLRVEKDSTGPDGDKPVPTWHQRQQEMV